MVRLDLAGDQRLAQAQRGVDHSLEAQSAERVGLNITPAAWLSTISWTTTARAGRCQVQRCACGNRWRAPSRGCSSSPPRFRKLSSPRIFR